MSAPDFIIIGGAKCGTTSILSYCAQHPEIYVSLLKEARFLAYDGEPPRYRGYGKFGDRKMRDYDDTLPGSWQQYQALFEGARPGQKTGEASPAYLYLKEAPGKIRSYLPAARLLVILRNPVERAFSSYLHLRRDNSEDLSFEESLAAEPGRLEENAGLLWRYLDLGFYGEQLQRYQQTFPEAQLLVLLYEDLLGDQEEVMRRIFQFIGVDPGFKPDTGARLNVSQIPRNRFLYNLLIATPLVHRLGRLMPSGAKKAIKGRIQSALLRKPVLEEPLRRQLAESYRSDIQLLQKLIDRDLSHWLA